MKEIRIHGRGGQGSLVLAQFMAMAALEDQKFGLAFPFLGGGGERRGKPIMAFCRLDTQPIRLRSRVNEPDFVILQDATILKEVDVAEGLKPGGLMLVNTDKSPADLGLGSVPFRVKTFPADEVSRRVMGRLVSNTALLGAFAGFTGEFSLAGVTQAVRTKFPGAVGEDNARVIQAGYAEAVKEAS